MNDFILTFNKLSKVFVETQLNVLWQSFVLLLITISFIKLAKRTNASTKFLIYRFTFFSMVVLPLLNTGSSLIRNADWWRNHTVSNNNIISRSDTEVSQSTEEPLLLDRLYFSHSLYDEQGGQKLSAYNWHKYVFLMWLIASFFAFIKIGHSLLFTITLRNNAKIAPRQLHDIFNVITKKCGGNQQINIFITDSISVPVTVSPGRPAIYFPEKLLPHLNNKDIEHIILHELKHIQRKDFAKNFVERFFVAVYALNPVLRWIKTRLDFEREVVCDHYAAKSAASKSGYCKSLLKLAQLTHDEIKIIHLAHGFSGKKFFRKRIKTLAGKSKTANLNISRTIVFASVLTLSFVLVPITENAHLFIIRDNTDLNAGYGLAEALKNFANNTFLTNFGTNTMEIFTAIEKGNLEEIKRLLEANPDLIHVQDKNGDGLLHLAAWYGQAAIARFLLEQGIDIDKKNKGRTALHTAFEASSRIANLLKEHGAYVDINLAAGWGDEKRMRELLDTNPKLANDISTGITALEWAAYGDADKGIDILVEYGADVNFRHPNGGFTAFFPAAETNHVRAAKALTKNGGDFRVANDNGDTPLHYAAVMRFTTDAVPYARYLLEKGADVNAKNKQGLTPLALMQRARNSQKDNWHPSAPKPEVKNFTGMEALLKKFGGKE